MCAQIIISYIPNATVIHANACWYILLVLALIVIHANTFTMSLAYIVVGIGSVLAHSLNQYILNTDWCVLNTYLLVLNRCWCVFST